MRSRDLLLSPRAINGVDASDCTRTILHSNDQVAAGGVGEGTDDFGPVVKAPPP